jgi:hypothetical protein
MNARRGCSLSLFTEYKPSASFTSTGKVSLNRVLHHHMSLNEEGYEKEEGKREGRANEENSHEISKGRTQWKLTHD